MNQRRGPVVLINTSPRRPAMPTLCKFWASDYGLILQDIDTDIANISYLVGSLSYRPCTFKTTQS